MTNVFIRWLTKRRLLRECNRRFEDRREFVAELSKVSRPGHLLFNDPELKRLGRLAYDAHRNCIAYGLHH